MGDAAPIFRRGDILLAGELLAGADVPEAELRLQPAVALARHAAGDQRLRVDRFQFWNCGATSMLVMRSMKAAGSIGANSPLRFRLLVMTPATSAPAWRIRRRARHEGGDRDRHRLEIVGVDAEPPLPPRRWNTQGGDRRSGRDHEAASGDEWDLAHVNYRLRLYNHNMSLRPNVIGMYFQVSYCSFGRKE